MIYVKGAEFSWQGRLQRDAYFEVDCTKIRTEREVVEVRVTASDLAVRVTASEQRQQGHSKRVALVAWRGAGVYFPQALGVTVEVQRVRTGSFACIFTASCKLQTSREHTNIVSVRVCPLAYAQQNQQKTVNLNSLRSSYCPSSTNQQFSAPTLIF